MEGSSVKAKVGGDHVRPSPGADNGTENPPTQSPSIPSSLRHIIQGLESPVDMIFFNHFYHSLSKVLTVHDNVSIPFREIIVPMVLQDDNQGLRHSLLCFSGLHIIGQESNPMYNARQEHHYACALKYLSADVTKAVESTDVTKGAVNQDPTIATTIIHLLIYICKGSTDGSYRIHLDGAREWIANHRFSDPVFFDFFLEYFVFHEIWNSTTSIEPYPVLGMNVDETSPKMFPDPAPQGRVAAMVGVKDGLLGFITRIASLRRTIRSRRFEGKVPAIDYPIVASSLEIKFDLDAWTPVQEPNTPAWYFSMFCRECIWVYLYRTIKASKPSEDLTSTVDDALVYLKEVDPTESTQALLLSPLFILGCAAFQEWQRPPIETAFENLLAYSNLGNIRPARQVVRRVWELMDAEDEKSWDWESIMKDMRIDLLVT